MTTRKVSISEFKAHCTEEIRQVEKGDLLLELTRHGKTVALVQSPAATASAPTLQDWVGSGKGTVMFAPDYEPSTPAFGPDEWEF
jgi:prevent-host-death family protein